MIDSKDKCISPRQLEEPAKILEKSDLRSLPKYICYKAALLRERLVLTYLMALLGVLFMSYFVISRFEILQLHKQLRSKEYILAPGVLNFTPASPQAIPDSYIQDAVSDFIASLGNVNASNIEEAYRGLKRFMSQPLQVQFDTETKLWVTQVQKEDLAQIVRVDRKEIISNEKGNYRVTAFVRADFYASGQYLGHENQVVEMNLKLVPPDQGRRWFLQIEDLKWSKLENFKNRYEFKKAELKQG